MPRRTPGPAGRRLSKEAALALLHSYDADPVGALSAALRTLLDRPEASWPELVAELDVSPTRRAALLLAETEVLDELAAELNETRTLPIP